jgi:hypothetical protein
MLKLKHSKLMLYPTELPEHIFVSSVKKQKPQSVSSRAYGGIIVQEEYNLGVSKGAL